MTVKVMYKVSLFFSALLLGFLAFPSISWGVMSSTNYTIFSDSVDSGGVLSTGGAYNLQDTAGESPVGTSTGGVYQVVGGFQAMDWDILAISIDTATIDLGALSTSAVASSTAVVSVTANATDGYVLSVASVGGTSLASVSDGTVTAGSEEYGVAVSGLDAAFSDDRAITVGLNLSASSSPVDGAQTTLTFKAAMSGTSAVGARSQSVTLTASTNL
jgi:hypothetical protein